MTSLLVSPPEFVASVPPSATPQQCIAMWLDLMNASEQLLLAGLRREIGPHGDIKAAYRKWCAEQMDEHDRTMRHMLARLDRAGGSRAQ